MREKAAFLYVHTALSEHCHPTFQARWEMQTVQIESDSSPQEKKILDIFILLQRRGSQNVKQF